MNTLAFQEIVQIQQDLHLLKNTVELLQQRLNSLLNHLQPTETTDSRPPLAQLQGIWEGLDLSLEEIRAAEYQGVDNL